MPLRSDRRLAAPSPLVGEGWGGGRFGFDVGRRKALRLRLPPSRPSLTRGEADLGAGADQSNTAEQRREQRLYDLRDLSRAPRPRPRLRVGRRHRAPPRRRCGRTQFFHPQRRPGSDLPHPRRRRLGACVDRAAAALHGRLLVPSQTAARAARRTEGHLYARQLSLFPVRLARRHQPLERHSPARFLDHHLRLGDHHHRQFRDLLSARLLYGAGRAAEIRYPADVAAGRAVLDQRNPARLCVSRAVRHRRRHQRRADRA